MVLTVRKRPWSNRREEGGREREPERRGRQREGGRDCPLHDRGLLNVETGGRKEKREPGKNEGRREPLRVRVRAHFEGENEGGRKGGSKREGSD